MRKLLNTLYANDRKLLSDIRRGKYCNPDGEKVLPARFPLHTLENVVCFPTYKGATPSA